ncbi:hypothetical protein GGU10DRAFT_361103, partial [Lentinula aff. detonsa]
MDRPLVCRHHRAFSACGHLACYAMVIVEVKHLHKPVTSSSEVSLYLLSFALCVLGFYLGFTFCICFRAADLPTNPKNGRRL